MCEEIRIYVADLAAYNNGFLHGVWIDACDDLEDIKAQINEMLADSPEEDAEEYAIHDHEGFEGYSVSEYSGIDELHEIACFIDENPGIGGALLAQFCDDLDEARRAIEEAYYGCYKSIADYAEELTEGSCQIPEHLSWYVDYERMGRDMEMSGDIFTIETAYNEVHIFGNW